MPTGGAFLSICATDWGVAFAEALAPDAAELARFELSAWPVADTLAVTVDSVPVQAWTYAAADNAVRFDDGAVPGDGSVVEIAYTVVGECPS